MNEIYGYYNEDVIRVYQAFNDKIADEVVKGGKFGDTFSLKRMTWIKTSFLWMMHRSGWGTKTNQERILQIDISVEFFNKLLDRSVLTMFSEDVYSTREEWQKELKQSEVRCQFDPDKDIFGKNTERRAIQLGLKGEIVKEYIDKGIVSISDITQDVHELRAKIELGIDVSKDLPTEALFTSVSKSVKGKLNISAN